MDDVPLSKPLRGCPCPCSSVLTQGMERAVSGVPHDAPPKPKKPKQPRAPRQAQQPQGDAQPMEAEQQPAAREAVTAAAG